MDKLIAWVEIPSADFERAVKFYGTVLSLDLEAFDCGNGEKMACLPTSSTLSFKNNKITILI
jgi:predicted enzyme related to lactoylglutathione lyase